MHNTTEFHRHSFSQVQNALIIQDKENIDRFYFISLVSLQQLQKKLKSYH